MEVGIEGAGRFGTPCATDSHAPEVLVGEGPAA